MEPIGDAAVEMKEKFNGILWLGTHCVNMTRVARDAAASGRGHGRRGG